MPATLTPHERQAAKREIVRAIAQGVSKSEARTQSPVPMHRVTVYRLLKRVQSEGERAFADGRHGHPYLVCGEVFALMCECCQANPSVSSSVIQRLLQERLGVCVSVSQLNRVRASLGLSRKPMQREKKAQKRLG